MKIPVFVAAYIMLLLSGKVSADEAGNSAHIGFNEHIRPILSQHCYACHGPDSSSRKAELRLDTYEGLTEGEAIVAGNGKDSELIARINSSDPDLVMPPPDIPRRLKPNEKLLLAKWIDEGAEWGEHWAFVPPRKVELPQPPGIEGWARSPIDHFVFQKLQELKLRPNATADRHTLARRAAIDLTGLPPNKELIKSFITDKNKDAYDRYIDALLASEHAGEHRARFWLDAARYGDTHGMHVDNYREIWPYRDWVIRAFNINMPFDQFVIEQIAGDLLPERTLDQQIATGFSRCNITTAEGGAIPDELRVRYMVDRVETTATVFLGLTAGCAVCHDHKFDPISQREFYQLGAFFNNTTQPALDGNQKDTPPVVTLPDEKFQTEWNELQSRRKLLQSELKTWNSTANEWWPSHSSMGKHPITSDGLALWLPLAEGEGYPTELPKLAEWETNHPAGRRGMRFDKESEISISFASPRSDEPFSVSFWFRTPDEIMTSELFDQTMTKKDKKDEKKEITIGWKITSSPQGGLRLHVYDAGGKNIVALLPGDEALTPRTWQHICVRYSGGLSNSSISLLVNGRAGNLRNATENLIDATELADVPLRISSNLPTAGLSDIRIYRRWISDEETQLLSEEIVLRKLLQSETQWNDLSTEDRKLLTRYYNQTADKKYQVRSRELADTVKRQDFIYSRSTTTLVMQERSSIPRAWILKRGEYDQRGDEVGADVPAVLPQLPNGASGNRLGLAQWLMHPDHPLTARVTVNRLWQSVFGVGLVKTSEDFGMMGEAPSNPQLLDWLAVEFVESGWNVKHILKLIVNSATYRQSGHPTPEKLEKDPGNRFISRGSRLRLDAEVLRDQALAVSGLLKRKIGGPSVRPYQPSGLWNVVAITGSNTGRFKQDSGDALYRRSFYTFWKRTSPPPSMAAFNAPTREQCTVRRERTNTPLQALVLMNDPQYVEAARHLAERTLKQTTDDHKRVTWMLETVLSRPANEADIVEMLSAANDFRTLFQKKNEAAAKLVGTGESIPDPALDVVELAAWTMVANTLMNRDDFINKE